MKRWIAAALAAAVALPAAAQDAKAPALEVERAEGGARLRLRRNDGARTTAPTCRR